MLRTWLPCFAVLFLAVSCSENSVPNDPKGSGGKPSSGGSASGGATTSTGGATNTGGSAGTLGTGGAKSGGTVSSGGTVTSGGTAVTGGAASTGGTSTAGSTAVDGGAGTTASGGTTGTSAGGTAGGSTAVGGSTTPGGPLPLIQVSENKRFLQTADGKPFYWQADTAWLLFVQLKREEVETYLENRRVRGFNVVQVMVLDNIGTKNKYGDVPFTSMSNPIVTQGSDPSNAEQYDWWDHADFVVDTAAKKGIYVALVVMWGEPWVPKSNVADIKSFSAFLANRYKERTNIFYINGGDRPAEGAYSFEKWNAIGETLDATDPNHLITYHPRGHMHSSTWFHKSAWLDFNMFQTGHAERLTWEYVSKDYVLTPPKPTLDGEPAYEEITVNLDGSVYWTDVDNRRHGWRSVLAGAAGHTYGHNDIWQFSQPGYPCKFACRNTWQKGIEFPGGAQMQHIKNLMLSRMPYFDRVPDQTLIAKQATGGSGETNLDYLVASRGERYAFIHTVKGATMEINMGKIAGAQVKASWYDPRTGKFEEIGPKDNAAGTTQTFDPPGEPKLGNDWVLVLDSI